MTTIEYAKKNNIELTDQQIAMIKVFDNKTEENVILICPNQLDRLCVYRLMDEHRVYERGFNDALKELVKIIKAV